MTFTGVGGTKSSIGSIAIHICLGGVRLLLTTHIIEADCPCLISIQTLRDMKAALDVERGRMWVGRISKWVDLEVSAHGHLGLKLLDFADNDVPVETTLRPPITAARNGPRLTF